MFQLWAILALRSCLLCLKAEKVFWSAKPHHKWSHLKLLQRPKSHSSLMAGSRGLDPDFGSRIREFEIRILRIQWQAYIEQLNDFSSVWILSWVFKWLDVEHLKSHFEQVNGFSPVWTLSWFFKSLTLVNVLSHFEQINGFSSVWILSWVFKCAAWLNFLAQLEQLNGFSSVWIL